jgi:hypothetical protein
LPSGLSEALRQKILYGNALATYPRLAKAIWRHGGKRMSTLELDRGRPAEAKLRVIDCDIHPAMNAWTEVHPYPRKKMDRASHGLWQPFAATPFPRR